MNNKLSKKLLQLNNSTDALLKGLEKLDNNRLNKKPDESSWSVNQVLNHIKMAEEKSLQYCKKKIQAPDLRKANFMSGLRLMTLKSSFILPIKFKAPKGVGTESLPEEDSLESISMNWKENRSELEEFLNSLSENQQKLAVYRHPAIGRISFPDMLGFFQIHLDVHKKQISRTLKELGV